MTEIALRVPDSHRDAKALLTDHKLGVQKIVGVDVDSILFVDLHRKPFTAWLRRSGGTLEIRCEEGYPAERGVLFQGEGWPHEL